MAPQAGIENLIRFEKRERSGNSFFAAVGVHVVAACAVAAFATGIFRLFFTACQTLEMRIAIEFLKNRVVAVATNVAADKLRCFGKRRRREHRQP